MTKRYADVPLLNWFLALLLLAFLAGAQPDPVDPIILPACTPPSNNLPHSSIQYPTGPLERSDPPPVGESFTPIVDTITKPSSEPLTQTTTSALPSETKEVNLGACFVGTLGGPDPSDKDKKTLQ